MVFGATFLFVWWEQRGSFHREIHLAAVGLTFAFLVVHPFPFVHHTRIMGGQAFTNIRYDEQGRAVRQVSLRGLRA